MNNSLYMPHSAENKSSNDGDFVSDEELIDIDRAGLSRHLAAHGLDYDSSSILRQFAGGFANRNYLIEIDGELTVLRRPPAGILPRGAHDMAREHRILSALSLVLPFVPRSLHFCADTDVLGVPFQLIEYRPGLVIRRQMPGGLSADAGAILSEMLVRTLAAVHSVDTAACGLGDLGRPEGFVERTIVGWHSRGREIVASERSAARLEELTAWLLGHRMNPRSPTLLHLDFKLDNMVLDPATLQPRALLDWDMGTRGDPLFDVATLSSYWPEPNDPPGLIDAVKIPALEGKFWSHRKAAEFYSAITGCDLSDLRVWRTLALMKLGIVFLQLDRQWTSGAIKGDRYATFRVRGEQLLDHALDLASRSPE